MWIILWFAYKQIEQNLDLDPNKLLFIMMIMIMIIEIIETKRQQLWLSRALLAEFLLFL